MPQSLSLLVVHLVFSTKDRTPLLDPSILPALHAYLATVARDHGCDCYLVGGVADHVHLALRLSRTVTVAHLVEKLKTTSTIWLKTQSQAFARHSWQRGYAAFSVGPSDLEVLRQYIHTQEAHHKKISFQDELRVFLKKYEMDYDECYIWD